LANLSVAEKALIETISDLDSAFKQLDYSYSLDLWHPSGPFFLQLTATISSVTCLCKAVTTSW